MPDFCAPSVSDKEIEHMKSKTALFVLITIATLFHFPSLAAKAHSTSSIKSFPQSGEAGTILPASATQAAPLPDLVIRQVIAVAGSDKKLRAHIVNVGNADAGACNLLLFFQQNGQTAKRGTYVTPIAKGKDLWVDVNNDNPIAAASSISLRIDDPNRVKESNELNNSYKFK
jgi:hypothetical protein